MGRKTTITLTSKEICDLVTGVRMYESYLQALAETTMYPDCRKYQEKRLEEMQSLRHKLDYECEYTEC